MNTTMTTQHNDDQSAAQAILMEGFDAETSDSEVVVLGVSESKEKAPSQEIARRDPLEVYMQDTKRFPLLTREQEHALALRLVEDGDASAARTLVESNLRLVVKIAYEYQRAHQNLLDVVQEGNIGLLQAVAKFDPHRGVKLSSYASWWIRAYMLKFILNNHRMVKIGTTQAQRKLFFNLKKERDRLEAEGFTADAASIAKSLDVREKDVVDMQKRLASSDASFDAPLTNGDDGGTRTRHDLLEDTAVGRPDQVVEEVQFHNLLKEKLEYFANTLEGREESIFRKRWLSEEPLKLRQLGEEFGVSRERARQLEKRLLSRVRLYLEKELGSAINVGMNDQVSSGMRMAM